MVRLSYRATLTTFPIIIRRFCIGLIVVHIPLQHRHHVISPMMLATVFATCVEYGTTVCMLADTPSPACANTISALGTTLYLGPGPNATANATDPFGNTRPYEHSSVRLIYNSGLILVFAVLSGASLAECNKKELDPSADVKNVKKNSVVKWLEWLSYYGAITYTCTIIYCLALQKITIINTGYMAWGVVLLLVRQTNEAFLQRVWQSLAGFTALVMIAEYCVGLTAWSRSTYAPGETHWVQVAGFHKCVDPTTTLYAIIPSVLIYMSVSLGSRSKQPSAGPNGAHRTSLSMLPTRLLSSESHQKVKEYASKCGGEWLGALAQKFITSFPMRHVDVLVPFIVLVFGLYDSASVVTLGYLWLGFLSLLAYMSNGRWLRKILPKVTGVYAGMVVIWIYGIQLYLQFDVEMCTDEAFGPDEAANATGDNHNHTANICKNPIFSDLQFHRVDSDGRAYSLGYMKHLAFETLVLVLVVVVLQIKARSIRQKGVSASRPASAVSSTSSLAPALRSDTARTTGATSTQEKRKSKSKVHRMSRHLSAAQKKIHTRLVESEWLAAVLREMLPLITHVLVLCTALVKSNMAKHGVDNDAPRGGAIGVMTIFLVLMYYIVPTCRKGSTFSMQLWLQLVVMSKGIVLLKFWTLSGELEEETYAWVGVETRSLDATVSEATKGPGPNVVPEMLAIVALFLLSWALSRLQVQPKVPGQFTGFTEHLLPSNVRGQVCLAWAIITAYIRYDAIGVCYCGVAVGISAVRRAQKMKNNTAVTRAFKLGQVLVAFCILYQYTTIIDRPVCRQDYQTQMSKQTCVVRRWLHFPPVTQRALKNGSCDAKHQDMAGKVVAEEQYSGNTTHAKDQSCCQQCTLKSGCTFWVRDNSTSDTGRCWLKDGFTGYISNSTNRSSHAHPPHFVCPPEVNKLIPSHWSNINYLWCDFILLVLIAWHLKILDKEFTESTSIRPTTDARVRITSAVQARLHNKTGRIAECTLDGRWNVWVDGLDLYHEYITLKRDDFTVERPEEGAVVRFPWLYQFAYPAVIWLVMFWTLFSGLSRVGFLFVPYIGFAAYLMWTSGGRDGSKVRNASRTADVDRAAGFFGVDVDAKAIHAETKRMLEDFYMQSKASKVVWSRLYYINCILLIIQIMWPLFALNIDCEAQAVLYIVEALGLRYNTGISVCPGDEATKISFWSPVLFILLGFVVHLQHKESLVEEYEDRIDDRVKLWGLYEHVLKSQRIMESQRKNKLLIRFFLPGELTKHKCLEEMTKAKDLVTEVNRKRQSAAADTNPKPESQTIAYIFSNPHIFKPQGRGFDFYKPGTNDAEFHRHHGPVAARATDVSGEEQRIQGGVLQNPPRARSADTRSAEEDTLPRTTASSTLTETTPQQGKPSAVKSAIFSCFAAIRGFFSKQAEVFRYRIHRIARPYHLAFNYNKWKQISSLDSFTTGECIIAIGMGNSEIIVFISAIIVAVWSPNLLSLGYTAFVLLWGILQRPRSTKHFWDTIMWYCIMCIGIKFIFSFRFWGQWNTVAYPKASCEVSMSGNECFSWPRVFGILQPKEDADTFQPNLMGDVALLCLIMLHRSLSKRVFLWNVPRIRDIMRKRSTEHGKEYVDHLKKSEAERLKKLEDTKRRPKMNLSDTVKLLVAKNRKRQEEQGLQSLTESNEPLTPAVQVSTKSVEFSSENTAARKAREESPHADDAAGYVEVSGGSCDDQALRVAAQDDIVPATPHISFDQFSAADNGVAQTQSPAASMHKRKTTMGSSASPDELKETTDRDGVVGATKGFVSDLTVAVYNNPCNYYYHELFFQVLSIIIVLVGWNAFTKTESQQLEISKNQVPLFLCLFLLGLVLHILVERMLYRSKMIHGKTVTHFIHVIAILIGVPFALPSITGRSFASEGGVYYVLFYVARMLASLVSAYQIRFGFMIGHREAGYNTSIGNPWYYSWTVYRVVPFIYEMTLLADWAATPTTLTLKEWLKLYDIDTDLYKAKMDMVVNRDVYNRAPYGRDKQGRRKGDKMPLLAKSNGALAVLGLTLCLFAPLFIVSIGNQLDNVAYKPFEVIMHVGLEPTEASLGDVTAANDGNITVIAASSFKLFQATAIPVDATPMRFSALKDCKMTSTFLEQSVQIAAFADADRQWTIPRHVITSLPLTK